jgi:polar amino acid transport system substrate-binding protein
MKQRNVVLPVFLVLCIIVLSACSNAAPTATATSAPTAAATAAATEAATAAPTEAATAAATEAAPVHYGDVCLGTAADAIVDLNCKEITIAVENLYLPFNYILVSTGEAGGWDYDAWTDICTRLHCTPKFVESAWDGLVESTGNGQYDVAADGITINDARRQQADFSIGYMSVEQKLLVRKGETRFTSIEDIVANPDFKLGTQISTTNYETAAGYLPDDRISGFETFPFAVQALLSGDIDAVIMDSTVGEGYVATNPDQLDFIGPAISSDELGFAFPLGSDLVKPVDKALQAMKDDGTLAKLQEKYFGPAFSITSADVVQ